MALTPEDLAAISKLLEGTEQRLEGKIEAVKQELLSQMAKDREDMAEFFQKTWEMMEPTNAELNERVTALEEHTGIVHKN